MMHHPIYFSSFGKVNGVGYTWALPESGGFDFEKSNFMSLFCFCFGHVPVTSLFVYRYVRFNEHGYQSNT